MLGFRQFLLESKGNVVAVYAGRFQPFHPGHHESYMEMVKKFGRKNVYIGTSNKTDSGKSPLNFKEKKRIITTMFKDVLAKNVVQIKNPFQPEEILKKFPKDTVYVAGGGTKDADRLNAGKYFQRYTDKADEGYEDRGYVFVIPTNTKNKLDGKPYSGTRVREIFKSMDIEEAFKKIYGTIDKKIAKLLGGKFA